MRIQTFKNMKGLIHGGDPKRISCDKSGVLKIGTTEIAITEGKEDSEVKTPGAATVYMTDYTAFHHTITIKP